MVATVKVSLRRMPEYSSSSPMTSDAKDSGQGRARQRSKGRRSANYPVAGTLRSRAERKANAEPDGAGAQRSPRGLKFPCLQYLGAFPWSMHLGSRVLSLFDE